MSRIGLNCELPWERSLDDLAHTIADRNVESDSDLRVQLNSRERHGPVRDLKENNY